MVNRWPSCVPSLTMEVRRESLYRARSWSRFTSHWERIMSSLRGFFIAAGIIVAALLLIKLVTFAVLLVLTAVLLALILASGFSILYALYVLARSSLPGHHAH